MSYVVDYTPTFKNPFGTTVTWSVYAGALPDGLELDPATGRIFGEAEDSTMNVVLMVTDGVHKAFTGKFNIGPGIPAGAFVRWRLDEGAGAVVLDDSGNSREGDLTDTSLRTPDGVEFVRVYPTTGVVNADVSDEGGSEATGYNRFGDYAATGLTDDGFTLSFMWTPTDDAWAADGTESGGLEAGNIIAEGAGSSGVPFRILRAQGTTGTGVPLGTPGSLWILLAGFPGPHPAPRWAGWTMGKEHHIVARVDPVANEVSLWADGVKVSVGTITFTVGKLYLSLGGSTASASADPCRIRDVIAYERPLTDEEIATLNAVMVALHGSDPPPSPADEPPAGYSSRYDARNVDGENNVTVSHLDRVAVVDIGPDGRDTTKQGLGPQLKYGSGPQGGWTLDFDVGNWLATATTGGRTATPITAAILYKPKFDGTEVNGTYTMAALGVGNANVYAEFKTPARVFAPFDGNGASRNVSLNNARVLARPAAGYLWAVVELNGAASRVITSEGDDFSGDVGAETDFSKIIIGAHQNPGAFDTYCRSEIAEVIFYESQSNALRNDLIAYLASRL